MDASKLGLPAASPFHESFAPARTDAAGRPDRSSAEDSSSATRLGTHGAFLSSDRCEHFAEARPLLRRVSSREFERGLAAIKPIAAGAVDRHLPTPALGDDLPALHELPDFPGFVGGAGSTTLHPTTTSTGRPPSPLGFENAPRGPRSLRSRPAAAQWKYSGISGFASAAGIERPAFNSTVEIARTYEPGRRRKPFSNPELAAVILPHLINDPHRPTIHIIHALRADGKGTDAKRTFAMTRQLRYYVQSGATESEALDKIREADERASVDARSLQPKVSAQRRLAEYANDYYSSILQLPKARRLIALRRLRASAENYPNNADTLALRVAIDDQVARILHGQNNTQRR